MNLVDIDDYQNYMFNRDLNQVYNIKTKKYIKNCLNGNGYYCVILHKDGKPKKLMLNYLIYKYNQDNPDDFVDIDDYEGIYKFNKNLNQVININTGKYIKNTICNEYYRVEIYKNGKKKRFQLHRLVYKAHNPLINIKGFDIDHINQNKLDNNIDNLRIATHSENQCNSNVYKNNKSTGIKNIYKNKFNTFQVVIKKDKKKIYKTFKKLEEAIEYRDLKLSELHGEFACFN